MVKFNAANGYFVVKCRKNKKRGDILKGNRIESLDSLRGIAAMIVVIFHCLLSFSLFYEANYEFNFANRLVEIFTVTPLHTLWAGKESVFLFFVLSGFVLMIPFTNNKKPKYSFYLIKRTCRIYIPYIIVMFISVVLTFLFWGYNNLEGMSTSYENRWNHGVSLKSLIAYVAMINYDTANVNGVVWTLFVEMKISLILPLFLLILSKFNWKKGLFLSFIINTVLLVIVNFGVRNAPFLPLRAIFIFLNGVFEYNYLFILGAVLAKQRHELKKFESMKLSSKYLILLLSLILINSRWVAYITDFQLALFENTVASLGIALLFFVVLSTNRIDIFLSKKYLTYLGKISFSLYLVHIPVLMLTTVFLSDFIPVWLAFCLVPILCIPVAHLSYMCIEKPAMDMGRKVANRFESKKLKAKTA